VNDPGPESEGGWNVAKVLGLIVGLLGMVGFGVCGLCGLALSLSDLGSSGGSGFVLVMALSGLALAALFFLLVRAMFRSARRRPPGASGP
jgi:hypothetical protein